MICFKDENGETQTTFSNMRRSTLYDSWKTGHTGYGSPDFNNADGCFDRMMVTRQLLKSFSQDVLATNKNGAEGTNNRVAMLDFGGFKNLGIGTTNNYKYAYVGLNVMEGYFPISNFVDFTDNKNSSELADAFENTKGYYATDYQSALKAAEQVLIPHSSVDTTWTNYQDYTKKISDNSLFDKGYIWSGIFASNAGQAKMVYDWENGEYTGSEKLVRVKGTREVDKLKKYVVFISDGAPGGIQSLSGNAGSNDATVKKNVRNALRTNDTGIPDDTVIDAVKKSADVVYSVGYQIADGKTDNLQKIASDSSSTYKNAQTTEEFTNFLNQIKETVLKYSCKSVTDTLGANYSFVCDADHQISIESGDGSTITYDSLDAAVKSGKFALSEDKKTLTWNGGDVGEDGVRISFYSKLDDEYLFPKSPGGGTNDYPTNSGQSLTYTIGEGDEAKDTTEPVRYDDYKLQVKSGAAKVVLSNNPAGDVKSGGSITYTLTVEKSGETSLVENVKVKAGVPDNTAGTGIDETGIEVGENKTYTVNVNTGAAEGTVISNVAHFTVDDSSISNSSDLAIDSINTNKVTNKVGTKTTITVKAPTVEKGTHDLTQVFIYTVTDSEGKEVAKVLLKQGESATIGDLKPGTYTVTEVSDWAWRYSGMDGEKEQTVTTTTTDTEKSVTFTKNGNKKTGWLSGHSSKWSNKHGTNGGVKTNE